MTYVDGFVLAVPSGNKEAYRKHAEEAAPLFKEFGAVRMVEAWGDDVPDGKVTDFKGAVKAEEGETVVFSWLEYPDKSVRDAAQQKMMSDPRMEEIGATMPFDGKRMIFGQASSRTCFEGHSTQEKTTVSPSFAFTAPLKSVTLPSGTSSPHASTMRTEPYSLKMAAAFSASSR